MLVENFFQGYNTSWDWITKSEKVEVPGRVLGRMIREAQEDYLEGYGFDWDDWNPVVTLSDGITASIEWTHKVTGRKLYLTLIYFNEETGSINQAGTNHGELTL